MDVDTRKSICSCATTSVMSKMMLKKSLVEMPFLSGNISTASIDRNENSIKLND